MTETKRAAAMKREALVRERTAAKQVAIETESDTEIKAYTVPAFVKAYGISRAQVFIELREGRLKARKYGNRNLILMEDAEAWAHALPQSRGTGAPYLSGDALTASGVGVSK